MFIKKFANDWIRTVDLQYWKQPLYQLLLPTSHISSFLQGILNYDFSFFRVVDKAVEMAKIRLEDVTAIAVTTKPGLSGSLT